MMVSCIFRKAGALVKLAVAGFVAIGCNALSAAPIVYVDAGTPLRMKVESGTWVKADGYYLSNANNAKVALQDLITTGDFHFKAVLRMNDFSRNPGCVLINELGEMGLRGSTNTSPAYAKGFFFGDISHDLQNRSAYIADDQDFTLDIQRTGDEVRITVNDKPFWTTTWEGDREFGKLSFRTASNGGLRIKSARLVSGNTAPLSGWVHPKDVVHEQPGEQVDVFSRGAGGYHTYRIPAIERTRFGTLLAFCEGRKNSGSDRGKIDLLLKRSTDGGRTWSPAQVVHSEEGDITIGNPVPIHDRVRNQTVLVFCRNNDRVFVTKSTDDGVSWETPREITASVKQPGWGWYATGPCHGLLTKAGRLIVPANHGSKAHTIYSDDFGHTWQIGGIMGGYGNEVSVAEISGGRILMNSRNRSTLNFRRQVMSSDGSVTWGSAADRRDMIEPTCQGNVRSATMENGQELLLFSNPASMRRERLTVRTSDNQGTTWSQGRIIYGGSAAYSDLCYLGDGAVGCLYERHWYDHITFARFDVNWLRNSQIENWKEEPGSATPLE